MERRAWQSSADPEPMLAFLRGRTSDRKLRLFACACCRRLSHLLVDDTLAALEIAEQFAEGLVDPEQRKRVRERSFEAAWLDHDEAQSHRGPAKACVCDALKRNAHDAAVNCAARAWHVSPDAADGLPSALSPARRRALSERIREEQQAAQAELLRDLFGNLISPVAMDREWLQWHGGTVRKLALGIYQQRSFDELPILADALEEAGCRNETLLGHCREPGEHVRGCWALDLLLGKN